MVTRNLPSGPYKWWLLSCLIRIGKGHGTAGEVANATADDNTPSTPIFVHNYSGYKLQGCFQEPTSSLPGEILGKDFILPTNASMSDQMTVSVCIDACDLAKPVDGASFEFVALGDGRECYCGSTLSPSSSAAADANCSLPCAADETASCGGGGFALVYSYLPGSAHAGDDPGSLTNTDIEGGEGISSENASDEATPFQPSDTAGPSSSGRTAAIVTGTLLSAVLVAFLALIAFKLRRRRQQQQQQQQQQQGSATNAPQQGRDPTARSAPSSPVTDDPPRETSPPSPIGGGGGGGGGGGDGRIPTIPWSTLDTVLVDGKLALSPATSPVRPRHQSSDNGLFSHPLAPHHHHAATTSYHQAATSALQPLAFSPPPPQQQQPRRSTSTASDLATPSTGILSVSDVSARSSAELDHHPAGLSPPSPPGAGGIVRTAAAVMPAAPDPAAALPSSLGDRAWHRRKWSRAFQPPPPPSVPLPPTPPGRGSGAGQEGLLPPPLSVVKPLGTTEVGGGKQDLVREGTRKERGEEDGEVTPAFTIWTVAPTDMGGVGGTGRGTGEGRNPSEPTGQGSGVQDMDGSGKGKGVMGGTEAGVGFAR